MSYFRSRKYKRNRKRSVFQNFLQGHITDDRRTSQSLPQHQDSTTSTIAPPWGPSYSTPQRCIYQCSRIVNEVTAGFWDRKCQISTWWTQSQWNNTILKRGKKAISLVILKQPWEWTCKRVFFLVCPAFFHRRGGIPGLSYATDQMSMVNVIGLGGFLWLCQKPKYLSRNYSACNSLSK